MGVKFGPTPKNSRPLRKWEACGDGFVHFGQTQSLFHFKMTHPWLWKFYHACAQVRCLFNGHEYSRLIERDKYISTPLRRTRCLYCGKELVVTERNNPGPLTRNDLQTAERESE